MNALDLFAGPGGWDLAAARLGFRVVGLENDPDVGKTRRDAGLETLLVDVAAVDPVDLALSDWTLLLGSPPCPTWSSAAGREGVVDSPVVYRVLRDLFHGRDTRHEADVGDRRTLLVVEPLRYALALRPRWVALEQVPAALEIFQVIADLLRHAGYRSAWTGVLNAADYGVPQIRERAILIADARAPVHPPHPTHAPAGGAASLFGELKPYVTMAEALSWEDGVVGFPRQSDGLEEVVLDGESYRARDLFPVDGPSPTLTEKARSWSRWPYERPSTTVQGDPRVWAPGHKENAQDPPGKYQQRRGDQAIRVTLEEAAVLQGFPARYPFFGTKTSRFRQVGNAIPPPLALAILHELVKGGEVSDEPLRTSLAH